MKRISGAVLAVLALAATFLFGMVLYQTLFLEWVGVEVTIVWIFTGVVGVITVGLLAGTYSVLSTDVQSRKIFTYLGPAVAVVFLVGVGVGFISDATDEHFLEVTMVSDDVEGFVVCSYSGSVPDNIAPGEMKLVFHNQNATSDTGWLDIVRLDEDRTTGDVIDHLEDGPSDTPVWATQVHLSNPVPTGTSTDETTIGVEPGLHVVTCGTNSPYEGQIARAFTVLP